MTTKVNEAILAVLDSGAPVHQAGIHAVIMAIPPKLLAELAIEQGGLVKYEGFSVGAEVLYRVVES